MKLKKNSVLLKLNALVMRVRIAGEGSSRVTVFDSRLGKMDLIAFGVRREKSSRRSALVVGNWITGEAEESDDSCALLEDCHLFKSFPLLTRNLGKSASLFLLFEVLDAFLPWRMPSDIFHLVEESLERLEKADDGEKFIYAVLLTLFSHEGLLPLPEAAEEKRCVFHVGDAVYQAGAGTARFVRDNEACAGNLTFWADKRLDQTTVTSLRGLISALYRLQTGHTPASLQLFIS